ncbi:MAG: bis(5'-nucleosyl)-tetraphosphatase (symmetrical) YqeK [Chloroflexi bacterium]|nr:bis(5'-nucleosyl)-tetraphosphatase (symmetrical) YqeK [Chloroflexota bacterium]
MKGQSALPSELRRALSQLPAGLREHIERVRQLACELGAPLDLEPERLDLAAAAHDVARALKGDALLAETRRLGLAVHPVEEHLPVLLHGPVAAGWLRLHMGVTDTEVLEAVHWHSTARAGLGAIAKVVFLADKLDPAKAARYPFLGRIRELARRDLEQAMVEFLTADLCRLMELGEPLHPASVDARNELLLRASRGLSPP